MIPKRLDQFGTIVDQPNYCIETNGYVYDYRTCQRVQPVSDQYIKIEGRMYRIDRLLADAYIGKLPFPIVGTEPNPVSRLSNIAPSRLSHITYHIDRIIRDPENPNIFWIDDVEFRLIPDSRLRYIISRSGAVYDLVRQRFLHRHWHLGYAHTTVALADRQTSGGVHVLVYLAYHGAIPKGMQVDHIDNTRWNNDPSNLQLLTHLDNTRKSRWEGARETPYTYEMMDTVCRMISENRPNSEIADYLNMPYDTRPNKQKIFKLVNKLRKRPGYYDDLKAKYDMSKYDSSVNYNYTRLTDEKVAEIREALARGVKGKTLAKQYNVAPSIISQIKNRRIHTN